MKIGFDGKRAAHNFTGLGNYSRYIIKLLSKFYPENKYSVYSPKPISELVSQDFATISSIQFHYPRQPLVKSWWRSFGIIKDLKKDGIQLYHGLSNELPFGIKKSGIRSVVTIHDLIFLRYPQYFPWVDRKIYNLKFQYATKHADKIIAISEQTKRDIINFYGIAEKKIEVIYQNCDPVFHQTVSVKEKQEIRLDYKLPEKYLLNVGTIESRKNLMLIVKALKHIPEEINLVVIGRETPYTKTVKEYIIKNQLAQRVHFLKNIPFESLPAIYQQAELFIYPSQFEGFGIPIIEALHSGIPVIAAKGSCLEEAGGKESIYVDSSDEIELANNIKIVLENPEKRQKMINAGYEHLKQFSDEKTAEKLTQLYQNILKNA
ncbi:MAG: glycosyltransferase family 1 protein [Daejeonella sp.]